MAKIGKVGSRIPHSVQNALGLAKIEKGSWGDLYLLAWDFSEKCKGEKCELYNICVYKDYWQMREEHKNNRCSTDKCMLQQRYLKNVLKSVMETMTAKRSSSQEQIIRLGYHVMPLYAQLFKFKVWEYGNHELVYISEKGTPKVHPIYREIRDIIKAIEAVWAKIGGHSKNKRSGKDMGDGAFIDAMYEVMGEEIQSEEEKKREEEIASGDGTGIDFEAAGVPDEAPKKTKIKKRRSLRRPKKKTSLHTKKK